MNTETIFWVAFVAIFFIGFAVDMTASKRRHKQESVGVALKWTAIWVSIAFSFGFAIYFFYPQNPETQVVTRTMMGLKFFSAYLTEYMLSIDNLFVFIMIFTMMKVRADVQPVLLKLGILLSIVLRCLFILVGMGLTDRFEWLIYLFGAFLILMTVKMIFTAPVLPCASATVTLERIARKARTSSDEPTFVMMRTSRYSSLHLTCFGEG